MSQYRQVGGNGATAWNSTSQYAEHPASEYDNPTWLTELVRAESMDLVNDPRFFTGNVIDKRLGAFGKLTVVSALMLGTSFGQMFALKKDMDFSEFEFGWLPVGWIQFSSFVMQMCVAFICLTTIYVLVHQTFYTYRLMTAGPHGFEQASMYYLNRTMCMWRRLAVKSLFNGLVMYVVASGMLVFVKFFRDAAAKNKAPQGIEVLNIAGGGAPMPEHLPKLDIYVHTALGAVLWLIFTLFGCFLIYIRHSHLSAFRTHYHFAHGMTMPLVETNTEMSSRAGLTLET